MLVIFDNLRDDIRDEAIHLLLKIFSNIINHTTNKGKYINLNAKSIVQNLSQCDPAGCILLLAGFNLSEDNTRLIWSETKHNIKIMTIIYNILNSMTKTKQSTNLENHAVQMPLIFKGIQQNSNISGVSVKSTLLQQEFLGLNLHSELTFVIEGKPD